MSKKRKIGKKGKKERCCQGGLKKGKTNTVRKRGVRGRPRTGHWEDFKEGKEGKEAKKGKKGRSCQGGLKKGKINTVGRRGVTGGPYGRPLRRMKTLCNLRRFLILRKERKERKPRKEKKGAPAKAV